jgi:hypothetical protein
MSASLPHTVHVLVCFSIVLMLFGASSISTNWQVTTISASFPHFSQEHISLFSAIVISPYQFPQSIPMSSPQHYEDSISVALYESFLLKSNENFAIGITRNGGRRA